MKCGLCRYYKNNRCNYGAYAGVSYKDTNKTEDSEACLYFDNILLYQLQEAKTGEEFYDIAAKIEKDYFVYRKRGYAEIDSLWLVDAKGHKYGNPAALTLYLGKIGDDAYIGYNVKDGYHTGKCLLRKAASFLEIKQE